MITKHNNASIVAGSMLILFGLLALFGQLFQGWNIWTSVWPLAIVGAGVLLFVSMFLGGKSASGFAVPASILLTTGLILFVQNLMHYWESWAYAWTLIVAAVGFGNLIIGIYNENPILRQAAVRTMGFGLLLFVLFGAFFEGFIFTGRNYGRLSQLIFPGGLILIGIYVLLFGSNLFSTAARANRDHKDQ